jgi:hypothetical protein
MYFPLNIGGVAVLRRGAAEVVVAQPEHTKSNHNAGAQEQPTVDRGLAGVTTPATQRSVGLRLGMASSYGQFSPMAW